MTEPPGPVCHQATPSSVTDLNAERATVLVNEPLPAAAFIWDDGPLAPIFLNPGNAMSQCLNNGGNKGVTALPTGPLGGLLGQQRRPARRISLDCRLRRRPRSDLFYHARAARGF